MDDKREAALTAALTVTDPSTPRPQLTPNQLAVIAREVATNVREITDILRIYNLSSEQYAAHIQPNGYYQQLLESYTKEWESIKSTNKRLAFQAGAALEEKLPMLAHRMGSTSEDLADVTSIAKLFTQLAGAGAPVGGAALETGERFAIHIVIGSSTVEIETKNSKQISSDSEESRQTMAIRPLIEGPKEQLEDPEAPPATPLENKEILNKK